MSVRINLTLEASAMFLSLIYDLQSRKSCCCLGYPRKNLGFWSFVRDDCPKDAWSSPLLLASDLLPWSLFGSDLGCLSLLWSCLNQSPFCTLYRDGIPGRQLLLPFLHLWHCHLQSGCRHYLHGRPIHSHLILSRKMLMRVGESRHPVGFLL